MSAQGVFGALARQAGAPEREFLRTEQGRRLSYAQVLEQSARLAHALAALGVRPGERLAVQVEKSPEAVLLYFAALRAGAVYLPLNSAYTAAELEFFLGDAQPALFVCTPEREAQLRPLAARLGVPAVATLGARGEGSLLAACEGRPGQFDDAPCTPADPAAILYTSGTTGRSKGAVLTHGNLLSNARTLAECWRFGPQDRLLHALPIFHIHGLFVAINVTLAAGAGMLFLPRFEAELILRHLPEATVMMGVPTFYVRLLKDPRLTAALVAGVRLFVSGSAPLSVDTFRAWQERTGQRILERYGLSETGMNCSNPYDGERVPGTVGPPLPGVSVRIADADAGGVGMIEVRGPNVFAGYWRSPERTREVLDADGWFRTGDLGRIDARGYVAIVGRASDLIISGGYNVYPKEIELEIDALPGVLESAVIGVPHPDFGEAVTAIVVRAGAAGTGTVGTAAALTEAAVTEALRQRLASYKLPKRVLFEAELPRNVMGKVQKALLRERYARLYCA